jgi:hydrogenase maturation protease
VRTLILGYGNADRGDDGVAWHVLNKLMENHNLPISEDLDIDFSDVTSQVDYFFQMQLVPEIAHDLDKYDRVCFVDAHTGAVPEGVHFEVIQPVFQKSPLTHHLTPASLMSIAQTIHHKEIDAALVSIRGYSFGFSRELSEKTQKLLTIAVDLIEKWMH